MTLTQGPVPPQSFPKCLVNPEGGFLNFRVLSLERLCEEMGKQQSLGLVWVLLGVCGKETWSSLLQ